MNFFVNEAMGIGNSGVEHAEFYRARRFEQAGLPYKYIFMELVSNLHEAMDKWHIKDDQVVNIWEYFVFGKSYAKKGIAKRVSAASSIVRDGTNTIRTDNHLTVSNMRIIKHFLKYPNPKDEKTLLVTANRVELFNNGNNLRKVMYEEIQDPHGNGNFKIQNIHLYNQEDKGQLFFKNLVQLRRYFINELEQIFDEKNVFIIDRGEDSEVAIMDDPRPYTNRKVISVVHADHLSDREDPENPFWNNYYEYTLTHLDRVNRLVVATELQRKDLLIDFPNFEHKIVTIPVGGVDDVRVQYPQEKKQSGLNLITVSRLADEKHVDLIIQAVINLRRRETKVQLDIYGAGGEKKKLDDLIKENHAEKFIKLKGLTHHANQIYPRYDAFISASYSEGFGLTYIEALNAGLPVITFNARFGAMEMIKNEYNGYSYEFKRNDAKFNIKQLEKGIKRVLAADISKMQSNIFKSVEDYRNEVIANKWRKLIDEL